MVLWSFLNQETLGEYLHSIACLFHCTSHKIVHDILYEISKVTITFTYLRIRTQRSFLEIWMFERVEYLSTRPSNESNISSYFTVLQQTNCKMIHARRNENHKPSNNAIISTFWQIFMESNKLLEKKKMHPNEMPWTRQ
jgi:hypothetical protein